MSDILTDFLLPGIITTTDRARYYSFYTWAVGQAAEHYGKSGGEAAFKSAFQRLEAAFALCSKLGQVPGSIVGIEQVNKRLREEGDREEISTDFRVLPSNDLGGFGQYYGGCLKGLRLVEWNEEGEYAVARPAGSQLAAAFAESITQASYLRGRHVAQDVISMKVLENSATLFSLDGLSSGSAEGERRVLVDMFLGFGEERPDAANRQGTLGVLLHVLSEYERQGLPGWDGHLDDMCLHWPHYYGCLYADGVGQAEYISPAAFTEVSLRWRQFCLHQLFKWAHQKSGAIQIHFGG